MNGGRWVRREIGHRPVFPLLFAASTAVGVASLLALVSVGDALRRTTLDHARELWAGDISIKAPPPQLDVVQGWAQSRWPGVRAARSIDTLSMARLPSGAAVQVSLSALSPEFPLYGKIVTRSGRPLSEVLGQRRVVVGDSLAARWGLVPGASLQLGTTTFSVSDVLVSRTDAPLSFFEFSPGVLLGLGDLEATGLLTAGSRSASVLYLNLPPGVDPARALEDVRSLTAEDAAEVGAWFTDNPGVFRFLKNLLRQLDFLVFLTLFLGGMGAATALSAAREAATRDIGVLFALGAPRSFVFRLWGAWIAVSLGAGILVALPLGHFLAQGLLARLGDMMPPGTVLGFPLQALGLAAGGSTAVIVFFALIPLVALSDISPNVIFSQERPRAPRRLFRTGLLGGVGGLCLWGVALAQGQRPLTAAVFVALGAGLWAGTRGVVALGLWGLRAFLGRRPGAVVRLAGRGLSRPGSLNAAAVVSVALSLTAVLTLFLVEKNLTYRWSDAGAAGAPNVFVINLREDQLDLFRRRMDRPEARFFPLVRGRVVAVNDRSVKDVNRLARQEGDRLTREFGFSFGNDLPPTDRVVEGKSLWDPAVPGPQVSVFEEFKGRFRLRRGDHLTVSVLGRRFTATIVSFRSIQQSARQPFFYFYFQPGLLEAVPHTYMGGLVVPPSEVPVFQNRLAEDMPNATSVDFSAVAALSGKIIARLGRGVRVLGLFGFLAGLVLLLAGLLVTLASRVREAALYRTLGATRGQVARVLLLEYLLAGGLGALVAGGLAWAAAGAVLRRFFDVSLAPFPLQTGALLGGVVALWVALSWIVTVRAFRVRPWEVLRHE